MSWDVELAKQFKKRDTKATLGPTLGDVISLNPLKISILGNKVILTDEHCYMCSKVNIVTGDMVLCLPTSNGQKFFIIDKVVT